MRALHLLRRAADWLDHSLPGQAIGTVALFATLYMILVFGGVLQ